MKKLLLFAITAIALPCGSYAASYPDVAARRSIAFSIVREDSTQDLEIIERYFHESKEPLSMIMVASGGCTAALLAAKAPLHSLSLVDPNKSQLELSRLKIALLSQPAAHRKALLGYTPMSPHQRQALLKSYATILDIDPTVFGNEETVAQEGLDYAGRYEKVFEELRQRLADHETELKALFTSTSIADQVALLAPAAPLGKALDAALDDVMSQANLVAIFGEKATANRVQDFSRHFAQRIRTYISHHLASTSPWLASMLLGHFYEESFPWLDATPTRRLPAITYQHSFMNDALANAAPESFHIIHLSNIIDWLTPAEAEQTLALAHRALKPGGVVVIRQLNSNVDIPALGKNFRWDVQAGNEFLHADRSFFYRNFFIGFKEKPSAAPQVTALALEILKTNPVMRSTFFADLPTMPLSTFQRVQEQFFFAVDYFSRPMAALIARLPLHAERIDTLHNMVEEHGDFRLADYHSNTFKQFLSTIGVDATRLEKTVPAAPVHMFNLALMGCCLSDDPLAAMACNGIIEYAFSDISAQVARTVVERGWVTKEELVHYNLHAAIDKEHAEDFFKVAEPYMHDEKKKAAVIAGLELGAYIFYRLYEDLYALSKN